MPRLFANAVFTGAMFTSAMFTSAMFTSAMFTSAMFATQTALAHINLLEPAARVPGRPDSMLRLGPCGQRQNERLEERVAVLRPGQSIDMVWDVYVQHVSYFRISFDPDGDDSFSTRPFAPSDAAADDPTELEPGQGEIILDYILDRAGDVDRVERSVILPDLECDRCTLQLTQFTYGLPLDESFYYQCADVVLDDGDGVIESSSGASGSAGAAGGSGVAAAGVGPALGASDPEAAGDSSGCSLAGAERLGGGGGQWWLVPLSGGLGLLARRSHRKVDGAQAR